MLYATLKFGHAGSVHTFEGTNIWNALSYPSWADIPKVVSNFEIHVLWLHFILLVILLIVNERTWSMVTNKPDYYFYTISKENYNYTCMN